MKICIDPGHGGNDPGAVGNGSSEKDINLTASFMLAACLNAAGHEVILTREQDMTHSLDWRTDTANRINADRFVSIHCNGSEKAQAHGFEAYYYPGSAEGKELATRMLDKAKSLDWITSRGVKTLGFHVLKYSKMPAVLVELGFITSDIDIIYLTDNMMLFLVMNAIAEAFS